MLQRSLEESKSELKESIQSPLSTGIPRELNSFRLEKCPENVYYVPQYLSVQEQAYLLKRIQSRKFDKYWAVLAKRRMQNLYVLECHTIRLSVPTFCVEAVFLILTV